MSEPVISHAVQRWTPEGVRADQNRLAVEAPLEIRVGGKPVTVIMRTPGTTLLADEELALGFLCGEEVIARAADVLRIERPSGLDPAQADNIVEVQLAPPALKVGLGQRSFYSSSSCGVCGKTSLAELTIKSPPVRSTLAVSAKVLAELPEKLRPAQATFAETGGVHASGLFDRDGKLLVLREDVGRHNALDKIVGWAVKAGRLPLADAVLVLSGRCSYELVQKAIVAGIPVIACVGAPSSLAVELAEKYGITLAGFLRPTTMNLYAHAQRVT